MDTTTSLMLYVTSVALGSMGCFIVIKYAYKYCFLDLPNKRSSHTKPIPKGGGIGILTAFAVSSFILGIPMLISVPAIMISLISLYSDKNEISPRTRLLIQFVLVSALVIIFFLDRGFDSTMFFQISLIKLPLCLFSIFFIIATANIYNFMDGINGIAGVTAIVAFGLLALAMMNRDQDSSYIPLCISICCACLGFLPYNIPLARVFMGDVGSILLGFIFSVMVVFLSWSIHDFVCFCFFLFPFYADAAATILLRIKNGENLFLPHRSHLYQLLANETGIAHWMISISYGIIQLIIGLSALYLKTRGLIAEIIFGSILFSCYIIIRYTVMRVSFSNRNSWGGI